MRIAVVISLAAVAGSHACGQSSARPSDGRLDFRAHAPSGVVGGGLTPLGLSQDRDGFLFVPSGNSTRHPAPLVILLHGATQSSRLFERLTAVADTVGVVLLAPDSRGMTWDAIRDDFGPDVAFLDRAIMRAFDRASIDSCRVVIGGFSDGATYALSLGIRNARRVSGVVAFSPGFVIPARSVEKVPVFLRHGTRDQILPIDASSRPIVRALREEGFDVDYKEFDGPHTVRPDDGRAALEWVKRRTCAH